MNVSMSMRDLAVGRFVVGADFFCALAEDPVAGVEGTVGGGGADCADVDLFVGGSARGLYFVNAETKMGA